jgi:hypothetical protein
MYYGGEQNIPGAPGNVGSLVAGNPSFDINRGAAGDSRRSRKGLSAEDVQRLMNANPEFAPQIQKMYFPGPQLPQVMAPGGGSNLPGAIGNMGGMQMAQGMPIIPMMGAPQNSFGVYDHPGLRGKPSQSIYDKGNDLPRMFPMQPGGLGIPQGMPGYEFDRKIPPANVVRDIPTGFDRKFVS